MFVDKFNLTIVKNKIGELRPDLDFCIYTLEKEKIQLTF